MHPMQFSASALTATASSCYRLSLLSQLQKASIIRKHSVDFSNEWSWIITYLPHVDSFGVSYGGQRRVDWAGLRWHGQQSGDSKRHPGRHGVRVKPKTDPWNDDQHWAGNVNGDEIVRKLAFEDQVHGKTAVFACNRIHKHHQIHH